MAEDRGVRVLLLGGTTEGAELASLLGERDDVTVISSLAGRVDHPRMPEGMVRVGGFGGIAGLEGYLRDEAIDVVVDATHPYAARISCNAVAACKSSGVALIALERPQWEMQAGDCWRLVEDMQAAALAVDREGSRVFLSVGRQELGAFSGCDKGWFLVRAIDAPSVSLPPRAELMLRRGPFAMEEEVRLLREHSINVVVSKNSGGAATYAKIEAARELGIPVVMIARPAREDVLTVARTADVVHELTRLFEVLDR